MNYGVIGNCQVAALVDERARLVWACLPRPDGDPVFSALLQKEGGDSEKGVFAIDMLDVTRTEQNYLRNSAILETRLYDAHGGVMRILDFAPRFRTRGRVFRPMMFVRVVEPMNGRPTLRLRLRPTSSYGERCDPGISGSHHIRFAADGLHYRVTTDASLAALLENRPVVLEQPLHFIIGPDETLQESPAALTREFLGSTLTYWQEWVRTLAVPADWQDAVIRAAITLKLCTYEDTGAVLAALTTSIPEAANSTRNWDYRYCWLRDSYFVIQTLNRLGATRTMEAYLHYIDHIIASSTVDSLQPLYGITGDPRAEEKIATSLSGYRGMGPVRFGNLAAEQVQHDVYGSVILAATQLFFDERLVRSGDQTLLERLYRLGKRAVASFEEPDAGPWEFRGKLQRHTFSAAISWAGCDRLGPHRAARRRRYRGARLECARQLHAPGDPHRRLERGAPVVHLRVRQSRPRCHGAAAARAGPVAGHRSTLSQDPGAHRGRAARGRPAVPLQTCRRFRTAGECLHDLRVLVRERAGGGRSRRRGARTIHAPAGACAIRSACCPKTSSLRAASSGAIFRRPTAWWE